MKKIQKFRILIVDDELPILNFLNLKLENAGYEVLIANNGTEAFAQVQAQKPDLLVLDIMMPGMDGFETLKRIRSISPVPVIILSAVETNLYKVKGLNLGADDYLAKPFHPDELTARIEAIRRRMVPEENRDSVESIKLGNATLNLKNHKLAVNGKEIPLTRIEWLLLYELARNRGKIMLYGDLLVKVWGAEYRNDVQILQSWVSHLRHKLDKEIGSPGLIRTVPKAGYTIDEPAN